MTDTRTPDMIYSDELMIAIREGKIAISDLPIICPECDQFPEETIFMHGLIMNRVAIACEGYHTMRDALSDLR